MLESISFLWRDRKRICGLPLSFTRYALSEDRLFLETGLLHTRLEELLLYRVRDISLSVSLGQRIFGVGSVHVLSSDKSTPSLELRNICRPFEVKEQLHRQVEQMKLARRLRIGELLSDQEQEEDED